MRRGFKLQVTLIQSSQPQCRQCSKRQRSPTTWARLESLGLCLLFGTSSEAASQFVASRCIVCNCVTDAISV